MNPSITNVKQFMTAFGQTIHDKPQDKVPYEIRLLRAKLIFEEALEYISALGFTIIGAGDFDQYEKDYTKFCGSPPRFVSYEFEQADGEFIEFELVDDQDWDLKLCLDAHADLDYVANGTALALGYASCVDEAYAEVHRSNMSKVWTEEEVSALDETIGAAITPVADNKFIITINGKVTKSPSYSRADLRSIIDKAQA